MTDLELRMVNECRSELPESQESHVWIPHQGGAILIDIGGAWCDYGEASWGRKHRLRQGGETKAFQACALQKTGGGRKHGGKGKGWAGTGGRRNGVGTGAA